MINILVIEDDEKLNKIVRAVLAKNGFNPAGCFSANEAFDRMIDIKFDLIISDIMMPGIDGFTLASLIREQNKTIPILFMSARDDIVSNRTRSYEETIRDEVAWLKAAGKISNNSFQPAA